jgi:hypothetical protein
MEDEFARCRTMMGSAWPYHCLAGSGSGRVRVWPRVARNDRPHCETLQSRARFLTPFSSGQRGLGQKPDVADGVEQRRAMSSGATHRGEVSCNSFWPMPSRPRVVSAQPPPVRRRARTNFTRPRTSRQYSTQILIGHRASQAARAARPADLADFPRGGSAAWWRLSNSTCRSPSASRTSALWLASAYRNSRAPSGKALEHRRTSI